MVSSNLSRVIIFTNIYTLEKLQKTQPSSKRGNVESRCLQAELSGRSGVRKQRACLIVGGREGPCRVLTDFSGNDTVIWGKHRLFSRPAFRAGQGEARRSGLLAAAVTPHTGGRATVPCEDDTGRDGLPRLGALQAGPLETRKPGLNTRDTASSSPGLRLLAGTPQSAAGTCVGGQWDSVSAVGSIVWAQRSVRQVLRAPGHHGSGCGQGRGRGPRGTWGSGSLAEGPGTQV